MKKRKASLVILVMSLLLVMSMLTLNIQPVNANPGCVTITVQYADGCPRSNAIVLWRNTTVWKPFGTTNETGVAILSNYLAPGFYQASAWYPDLGTQFGPTMPFEVNATGDGSVTITNIDLEITPPVIEILSPQNTTYTTTSVPLTFTVYDFSSISWRGYSLDGQANVTSGNTTLTGLALGSHNIIVYANDTNGNVGSSDKVYFTITETQPVGGIYIAPNILELLAPFIGTVSLIFVAVVATALVKRRIRKNRTNVN